MSYAPAQAAAPASTDTSVVPTPPAGPTIVVATIAPAVGETGVQTHSRVLHSGLIAAGHSCLIHTPLIRSRRWAPIFAARPLVLQRLNPTWSTWWLRHWHEIALRGGLYRTLHTEKVGAVIAQCPLSARAALAARRRAGATFPVLMVCHFNYSEATEYRDKGELASQRMFDQVQATEKNVLEAVDHVVFVSNWARDTVQRERGIYPRVSSVIWNGIPRMSVAPRIKRSDLGLDPHDIVLISVGTLEPRKNQIALVDLMGKLAPAHPSVRLVLVGDGPDRRQIEARIAELGLQSKVRLLGFRRDVPELLPLADIYVHASLLENCPMVLLEAARAGLPIAAVPAGGVPELLEVLGGATLDPRQPASLAPLLASPAARREAGDVARLAFDRHFTEEAMLDGYLRILESAAPSGGSAIT